VRELREWLTCYWDGAKATSFVKPVKMRGWRRSDGRPADTALTA
jgi:hypothetical protein